MQGEHVLFHPGSIILNGVPYELDLDPKTMQMSWVEEPILNGTAPKPGPGLKHTPIGEAAWLSEQVIDSYDMGMGDALDYEENTYHYGTDVDPSEPGALVLGPLRTQLTIAVAPGNDPAGYFELGGRLYLVWGRYIREIGALSGTPTDTADRDFGAGLLSTDAAIFRNAAIIALGNATPLQSRATGAAAGTYTVAPASLTADFVTVTEEFLYRAFSDGSVTQVAACPQDSSPLTAANWSAPVDIGGDSGLAFTDLKTFGYQVIVGKRDGAYRTNRLGFAPNIIDEFKAYPDAANARKMNSYAQKFYIPHLRGLLRYDGRGIRRVGLEALSTHSHANLGPVNGVYRALVSDGQWQYVAVWNGTDTYILKYHEITAADGTLRAVWHSHAVWSANQVTALHVTGLSGTNPSLWASSVTNNLISRFFLPAAGRVATQDSGYTYAVSGILYLPRLYFGSEENQKLFTEIVVEADNLTAFAELVTIAYRTTDNFPWSATSPAFTSLADISSSPSTQVVNVAGRFIEPRVTIARGGTTTETPVLRRIKIRAIQRIPYLRHIRAHIKLPPDAQSLEGDIGSVDIRSPETSYAALRALEAGTTALTLIDPWGVSRVVYLVSKVHTPAVLYADHEEPHITAEIHLIEPNP